MNETVVRALSGAVYVILLVFATMYSKESLLVLFGLFLAQTIREFSDLVKLPNLRPSIIGIFLFLVLILFDLPDYITISAMFISIIILWVLTFWLFSKENSMLKIPHWILLFGYIVLPFVLIVKLTGLQFSGVSLYNPNLIVAIFILIWTNDTFAYLTGKTFGKNKLFERISPKKTIEGFLGGMFFATIASVIISKFYITEISIVNWIIISIIVSFFGTIGDLVQSKFKRIAGVKDSGSIMPGHGGIYDRLDSVIFVVPFVYLFIKIINYVS